MHCDIDLEARGRSIGSLVSPRDRVAPGATVAILHHWREPARPPAALAVSVGGVVLAVAARGRLKPGDHAALVAEEPEQGA